MTTSPDSDQPDLLVLIDELGEIPNARSVLPSRRSDGSGNAVDALSELLDAAVEVEAACFIVSPPDQPETYVQCIATDVGFHLEAVSNTFLCDTPHRLSPRQHSVLDGLGWNAPDDPAEPNNGGFATESVQDVAYNWWNDLSGPGAARKTAELLLSTLVTVYVAQSEAPLNVEILPADCRDWVWTGKRIRPDE